MDNKKYEAAMRTVMQNLEETSDQMEAVTLVVSDILKSLEKEAAEPAKVSTKTGVEENDLPKLSLEIGPDDLHAEIRGTGEHISLLLGCAANRIMNSLEKNSKLHTIRAAFMTDYVLKDLAAAMEMGEDEYDLYMLKKLYRSGLKLNVELDDEEEDDDR